jgi:hypothetical protein
MFVNISMLIISHTTQQRFLNTQIVFFFSLFQPPTTYAPKTGSYVAQVSTRIHVCVPCSLLHQRTRSLGHYNCMLYAYMCHLCKHREECAHTLLRISKKHPSHLQRVSSFIPVALLPIQSLDIARPRLRNTYIF